MFTQGYLFGQVFDWQDAHWRTSPRNFKLHFLVLLGHLWGLSLKLQPKMLLFKTEFKGWGFCIHWIWNQYQFSRQILQYTMLQKFSKCEVKAAWCGNFTISYSTLYKKYRVFLIPISSTHSIFRENEVFFHKCV